MLQFYPICHPFSSCLLHLWVIVGQLYVSAWRINRYSKVYKRLLWFNVIPSLIYGNNLSCRQAGSPVRFVSQPQPFAWRCRTW